MQKWQFKFVSATNAELTQTLQFSSSSLPSLFESLGEEGWELVSVVPYTATTIFAFKKPVEAVDGLQLDRK